MWILALGVVMAAVASNPADFNCPVAADGTSFAGRDLTNENFHAYTKGSLRHANFDGAKLRGAVFIGVDLTGASFRNADLGPSDKGSANFSNATLDHTCFIGATMNATIFTFSTIKCADFSGTSLIKADFGPLQYIEKGDGCRTRFVGSTLDVRAIKISNPNKRTDGLASNWAKTDFTDANFLNLRPATFSLAGKNITGAVLAGTDFSDIDMRKANLTDVDFSRALLERVDAGDATLNGAKLRNAKLRAASFRCARFYGQKNDTTDNPNSKQCKSNPETTQPLHAADFTQATLIGAHFERATMNHATFTGANLSNASFDAASLIGASLQAQSDIGAATVFNANFTSVNFTNAQLNGVHFNDDVMTGAIFDRTTQTATEYLRSILPDTSWDTATLEGVSFQYAVLQKAQFTNTNIQTGPASTGTDFSCAQLGGANFSGATITAAIFQNSVMPAAGDCCMQASGNAWCGTIDITGENYGAVTFPLLQSPVTCPDGTVTQCQAANWRVADWKTPCNDAHEPRVAWQKPCDVTPPGAVTFADTNLRKCVLSSLGGATSISIATAKAMAELSCPGLGISSVGGLENFTGLTKLDLSSNQLTRFDLALPKLQTLLLSYNQLTTLDVSALSQLFRLEAAHNQLQDVVGIGIISPGLLDLSYNRLRALNLTNQANLTSADLSHNQLTSIFGEARQDLTHLLNLQSLDLDSNKLTTIGPLASLAYSPSKTSANLQSLSLACNAAFDCASLSLDGTYPAYQQSRCADFDVQSNSWTPRQHPSCPTAP